MNVRSVVERLGLEDLARITLLLLAMFRRTLIRWRLIDQTSFSRRMLIDMGSSALALGNHELAVANYIEALSRRPEDLLLRLQIGITVFLWGKYPECERWFVSCNQTKHFDLSRWGMPDSEFRVLDKTWMMAIGHVAFLDTYVKTAVLGWYPQKTAVLAYNPLRPPTGWPMFRYFSEHIHIVPSRGSPEDAVDELLHGHLFREIDGEKRDNIRAMMSQPFWYGPDHTGRTRWYGPYGASVEAAWKAAGKGPVVQTSADDRALFRESMLKLFGLPVDAWFVLLHVREPGYHAAWHKRHPGTRNADIRTYDKVIDFVLSKGGWVVRGGDPTMKRLPQRERVIDYALSEQRSPEIDILLCAECTYFVGTNSGFSLVPPVFGRRCALTNWSPVGMPNWYLDDVFIPKLIRRRPEGRFLTFSDMFGSFAGWSQFQRDFRKTDLVIEDNHPDDLLLAVQELHDEIFDLAPPPTPEDEARLRRFNEIVVEHGGYVGSRMSYRFLAKYPELLD